MKNAQQVYRVSNRPKPDSFYECYAHEAGDEVLPHHPYLRAVRQHLVTGRPMAQFWHEFFHVAVIEGKWTVLERVYKSEEEYKAALEERGFPAEDGPIILRTSML
jgi:hypothetical protein